MERGAVLGVAETMTSMLRDTRPRGGRCCRRSHPSVPAVGMREAGMRRRIVMGDTDMGILSGGRVDRLG